MHFVLNPNPNYIKFRKRLIKNIDFLYYNENISK